MGAEAFVSVFGESIYLVIKLVSLIVLPALIVGLIIAIFQAATSINEQTLTFLPRLIATLLMLIFGGHYFTQTLVDFFRTMILRIPEILI